MLLARVAFDLLRSPRFKAYVMAYVQKKLDDLKVPDYINALQVGWQAQWSRHSHKLSKPAISPLSWCMGLMGCILDSICNHVLQWLVLTCCIIRVGMHVLKWIDPMHLPLMPDTPAFMVDCEVTDAGDQAHAWCR